MKIVHVNETKELKNSDVCIAHEYSIDDPDINIATIIITGRYPAMGRAMNSKCKELGYVAEGSGKVFVDDKEITLEKGDVVLIEPGEKFYWDGNFTLLMSCTPAWTPEQYKYVND